MAYSRLALAHLQARRFFWGSGFWMVGLLGAGQVVKREHINDTSGESEYLRNLGAKQKTKVWTALIGNWLELQIYWVEVARKFRDEYDVRRVRVEEVVFSS